MSVSYQSFATLGSAVASHDLSRLRNEHEFIDALDDQQFMEFFRDLVKLHVTGEFEKGLERLRANRELSPDEKRRFIAAITEFDIGDLDFSRLERVKRTIADADRKRTANSGAVSEAAAALSKERATALAERDRQAKLAQSKQDELDRQKTELQEKQQRISQLEARLAAMERRQIEELTGLWRTLKPSPPAPSPRGEERRIATGGAAPPPAGPVRSPPKPAEPALVAGFKGLLKDLNEKFREPKTAIPPSAEPPPQPQEPPVPPAELQTFLQIAIPARADDYLRQLALVAAHANSIGTTSRLLRMELGNILDDRCRSSDPARNPWLG
jgi:flagellar motility protein MotE (MotC chaperone)